MLQNLYAWNAICEIDNEAAVAFEPYPCNFVQLLLVEIKTPSHLVQLTSIIINLSMSFHLNPEEK